ncbi:hypothetical protein [Streptomyces sp. NPDC093109]|uniref:hypothetical protein n=1 Tax=Streptomyces sp. NPDC093109 TaxID=3154977 RepID=UPI00344C3F58
MIATFGMNGSLVVPKDVPPPEPEPERERVPPEPGPGSGSDPEQPPEPADELSARVAERNKRSSRGGV